MNYVHEPDNARSLPSSIIDQVVVDKFNNVWVLTNLGNIGRIKVAILDPAATRTAMRAKAFPGEDPETLKSPEVVAEAVLRLSTESFETGLFERVE